MGNMGNIMDTKVYEVAVVETLRRVVRVAAESEDEAVEHVEQQVNDCEIVLDADDFDDRTIEVVGEVEI